MALGRKKKMFSTCDRCTVSVIRYGFNSKVAQVLVRYCLGWIYGHVISQCSFVFKGLFACGSNFELSFASIKVHSVWHYVSPTLPPLVCAVDCLFTLLRFICCSPDPQCDCIW